MFEEQITESIEAGAPNITYSGNEGPKSPQDEQRMKMAQLEEAYEQYVYEMIEMGNEPMSIEQFLQQVMAEGQMSKGPILPSDEDPINPFGPKPQGPVLPDRQMAAYGGIMGLDGRRQYGIGSSLKKFVRKVIPNEVADIAVKAAPFVAPFNPAVAGLMAGIGGFDQHGSISKGLKSGLMNYGLGNVARMAGGAGFQKGLTNPNATANAGFMNKYLSSPYKPNEDIFSKTKERFFPGGGESIDATEILSERMGDNTPREKGFLKSIGVEAAEEESKKTFLGNLTNKITKAGLNSKAMLGILGLSAAAGAYTASTEVDEVLGDVDRGTGLPSGILGIRTEVIEAFKDPTGEKLAAIRIKYPFLGAKDTKDMSEMAYGGRARRAEGGIMDLDGMELDYRAEGGFVPIGKEEKADDVPARLSVNEFVFTADAVRNAGGGDIDKGAEVMENMMKNLEQGGQVSEESQGMQGAQQMFETSERLSEVM